MNERDSEAVTGLLLDRGFETTGIIEEADLVLYNTCSVRQHAEQKVFGRMGLVRKLKARKPGLIVGLMGCMAQEHGGNFFRLNPEIDLVCGTGNISQIPDLVEEIERAREKKGTEPFFSERKRALSPFLAIDRLDDEYDLDGIRYRSNSLKTQVTIMKGCDHRCTYCIVPYTRGVEISRDSESILKEMKDQEERGFKDVMLLGQNVNSYGKNPDEGIDFADLLEKIQRHAPKIPRLRFITSHPKDAHTRLFKAMRDLPMVCEHLHLPVQSGANAVLRRMKREHTVEWYLEQIGEYRRFLPEGSLTTDFIVGFPGESEKDFSETLNLVEKAPFDSAYIFEYSPRPGTPALKLEDDVPPKEKSRRLQELLSLQRAVSFKKNQQAIGKTVEVLFESRTRKDENRWMGRTREYKRVVASSKDDLTGGLRPVKITAVADETLLGELL